MYVWRYGSLLKYRFDIQNKVSVDRLLGLGILRVPGISIIHTELVLGIPAVFSHFVTNLSAFHQVVIFLCIKSIPIPRVQHGEWFLVGRIGPRGHHMYRCIVRYGYREAHMDDMRFENELICNVAEFIRSGKAGFVDVDNPAHQDEEMVVVGSASDGTQLHEEGLEMVRSRPGKRVRFVIPERADMDEGGQDDLMELMEARKAGLAYILGHTYVRAKAGSNLMKKIVIDYWYAFMRRNSRDSACTLNLPHASTLQVGMVYQL